MIGGGCTSGAFVAGWPTLSVGNFAMGMTFFMTAMATAFLVYGRKRARFHEIPRRKEHLPGRRLREER